VKLEKARSEACRKETIDKCSSFDKAIADGLETPLNTSQNNMFYIPGLNIFMNCSRNIIYLIDQKHYGMLMRAAFVMIQEDGRW
jgi:hypothetical protein